MKVVLDTNVLISAAISIARGKDSATRYLFGEALAHEGFLENFPCTNLLLELRDVLDRERERLLLGESFVIEFADYCQRFSTLVDIQGLFMGCRDRRDDKILEVATNVPVDYIVCHDKDLVDPRAQFGISKTGIRIRDYPIHVVSAEALSARVRQLIAVRDLAAKEREVPRAGIERTRSSGGTALRVLC